MSHLRPSTRSRLFLLALLSAAALLVAACADAEPAEPVAAEIVEEEPLDSPPVVEPPVEVFVSTGETSAIELAGSLLVPLPQEGADPAIGQIAPELSGTTFDGSPLSITHDGRVKFIFFFAHW